MTARQPGASEQPDLPAIRAHLRQVDLLHWGRTAHDQASTEGANNHALRNLRHTQR